MKTLFEEINSWNIADDFELKFKILNLEKGWALIDKLDTDTETKNKLVRYTALSYSFDSPLLRKKRERFDNKKNICDFLDLNLSGYVLECVQNEVSEMNTFITWYLRESGDRAFAIIVSAEDLLFDLLQTARDGVEKVVTAKDEKQAEKVMKSFTRMEVIMKAEAFERAMKLDASIKSQSSELEKNYEYLHGIVKSELPEFANTLGFPEKLALKRRLNK